MNGLAKRLKILRESKNLSVTQVASEIGVAVSTYREWEHGRAIKGEPYVKLARLFEVSVYKLMTGQEGDLGTAIKYLDDVKYSLFQLEKELQSQV